MTKRRLLDTGVIADKVMGLDETIRYAQVHRVLLTYDDTRVVGIWTPGVKQPQPFKRGVHKNRVALSRQMQEGNTQLCPTPLHKPYWYQGRCLMCRQLDSSMNAYDELQAS